MALPVYSIEVAWSRARTGAVTIGTSTIGSADQIGGLFSHYTFASVKNDVKEVVIRRGRTGQDGAMGAGTCTVVLKDLAGTYNPENAGSSLAPNVVPLRPIRVRAVHSATTYGLFFGWITRIEHDPAPAAQQTTIEATDFFHWLDVARPVLSLPQTTVGAAVQAILAAAGLSDPAYLALDAGARALPPVVADGSISALALLQQILDVDMGVLFVDGDGKVTYQSTATRCGGAAAVDTLTNSLIGGARPATDIALVRNGWTVRRDAPGALPQTAYDATTRDYAYYGARDGAPLTSAYLVDDAQALALATFKTLLYKDPTNPVQGVRLSNRSDALIAKQLARDVGDKVTVTESHGGTSTTGFIEGVNHRIWGAGRFHVVDYAVSKQRVNSVTY